MKLLKKITSAVCAFALCIQASTAVFAETLGVHTDSGVAVASVDINDPCLSYLKDVAVNDDPSYIKFVRNQQQVGLTDFSSLVTHQSKFDGFNKMYGIDVSQYNGDIDFTKVKNEGYQYVIIRAGARGYGQSGTIIEDKDFDKNIDNAKKAGLMVGVYFYTQAITDAEIKQEADICIKKIAGRKLDLPVYFDIEPAYDWNGLPGRLVAAKFSKAKKAQMCTYFCDLISKAGYEGGVTSCKSWFDNEIDMSALENKYDIWLAHYTKSTDYGSDYDMWQFASTRKVNGVESSCTDQDVRYINTYKPTGYIKLSTELSNNTVTLKWTPVLNIIGYYIYKLDSSGKAVKINSTKLCSFKTTRENSDTKYYVQAFNIYNSKHYYSSNSNVVTVGGGKVWNVNSTCTTENSITLGWKAVSGATGYAVYLKQGSKAYKYAGYSNTASYTAKGLTGGASYSFKVYAFYNTNGSKEFKSGTSSLGKVSDEVTLSTVRNVQVASTKLSGENRYQTAALISQKEYPKGTGIVVLASGERYADALVSSPMAKSFNAPVLLTNKDKLNDYTLKEITRLGAKTVYIIGGYNNVAKTVDSALEAKGITVRRVFSSYTNDDFGTAVYVSANMDINRGKAPTELFIATVDGFADMLSIANIASARNAPILYMNKSGVLDGATKYYLNSIKNSLKNIYIIGGTSAVGSGADSILKDYAASVTRIKGSNRYETCIAVNKYFNSTLTGKSICVTTGKDYPDALAGGTFAASLRSPMLIADNKLNQNQKQYLINKVPTNVYILGGKSMNAQLVKNAINGK